MLIVVILLSAILSTGVLGIIDRINATGDVFAQVTYEGEPILKINLKNPEQYIIYQTEHKNNIHVSSQEKGVFYVPGEVTNQMTELYLTDEYARENQIVGIKLQVKNGKISVLYQESPRDLCQFEPPTDSSLKPIVCLPNKVVIRIITSETVNDVFLDDVLE